MPPAISVIVPVYNREAVIEKCLKGIRESGYKDYELIVVDCASTDRTLSIAKLYADVVIELHDKAGRAQARSRAVAVSKGRIIVNIDSDVVIKTNTLAMIEAYLSQHQDIGAVTGCLAKENPYPGFFSQYKNLYMYYNFKKLPEKVNFLYGSIYALRHKAWQGHGSNVKTADDTALGQQLVSSGGKIAFLKELEVTHLKEYSLGSFIKNDFVIPFDWAKIFLKYKGWRQLGKDKTGFAHASKGQLASVISAPLIFTFLAAGFLDPAYFFAALPPAFLWYLLNFRFIKFLKKEKGFIFAAFAFFVTLLDNVIMAAGITYGLISNLPRK